MKIFLFGVTGNAGQAILQEALSRGHSVTAAARQTGFFHPVGKASVVTADALDTATFKDVIKGHDAVIVAISGRKSGHSTVATVASNLLAAMPAAGVSRLLWVGGAGSLEVAPGVRLVDTPQFPAAYKEEALGQGVALQTLRDSNTAINWTYVSPPAIIGVGGRTGTYRVGGDQLLADAHGNSNISWIDYAVAIVDELEKNAHPKARITVAY
jgi:putative NADH-flavin reductase